MNSLIFKVSPCISWKFCINGCGLRFNNFCKKYIGYEWVDINGILARTSQIVFSDK